MAWRYLITGATGFVGGHLAEAGVGRGLPVSTIARAGSDAALLEQLGVTIYRGDLADPALVRQAVDNADVIVHCAAKVGDRGPVEEYRAVNVEALRGLLEACKGQPLHRFVHMSSLGVYEARHHHGTTEAEPLPDTHIDGYTQTKVEAEHLVQQYYRDYKVPVVVLRPGFVYGPRDKTVLPKLIERMKTGKIHYLGGEKLALNTIFVKNLVEAVFLAVDKPEAVGQVYNLTDGEYVSKRRFIEAIADALGLKKSRQLLPRWLAALLVRLLRLHIRRATAAGRKPVITHAQFKFMLLNLDFSIDKVKRELGYAPKFGFDQGMRETMAWYQKNP
ncbi:MAG: NAD(P)-dependent oxidoreductase [Planctomycetes bacterium]|nr:NAD(P)-dependent oxidoreductase [Planctomycetota bacterium]